MGVSALSVGHIELLQTQLRSSRCIAPLSPDLTHMREYAAALSVLLLQKVNRFYCYLSCNGVLHQLHKLLLSPQN